MNKKWQDLKKELKKGLSYLLSAISYVFISVGIGYFLVIYLGLPKGFYVSSIGIVGFFGLLDNLAGSSIIKSSKELWVSFPTIIHIWIILDCLVYYFFFKAYFNNEIIWKNLQVKLLKN